MKHLFLIIAFLTSVMSFAQDDTSINGNVLDLESNNAPLEMARISINETGVKTISDEYGNFKFERLSPGTYTVSLSFVGYETKTLEVKVAANRTTQIKESLGANTLSLEDLMLTLASADNNETSNITTTSN
ncbi:carboxypeptidase-like regulatory domain-containing protein [Algibacter sp. L1A34]|uniref:carboxypeptidase-like regulatory domain-containing protein n=1 Tax=Algibacter sp. L1A34 TaxID=2686365 RepID=UPI00131D3196|nr:carboxypeptidase-like regulatory domain-containing protein [Algibacter sp. L1A34]